MLPPIHLHSFWINLVEKEYGQVAMKRKES